MFDSRYMKKSNFVVYKDFCMNILNIIFEPPRNFILVPKNSKCCTGEWHMDKLYQRRDLSCILTTLLLVYVFVFIHYYCNSFQLLSSSSQWYTEQVGGLIRSLIGELSFTFLTGYVVIGSYIAICGISASGGVETYFNAGVASVLFFIPVNFVIQMVTDFSNRYSNYYLMCTAILQMLLLLLKFIRERGNLRYCFIAMAVYLLALIPCINILLDFLFMWLKGKVAIFQFKTLFEKGLW